MSFFNKILRNIRLLKTSLPFVVKHIYYYFTQHTHRKRTSLFISFKKGFLTVEATLIFPIFLTACLAVLFFAELFRLEVKVDEALFNCAKLNAQYAGLIARGEEQPNAMLEAGISGIGIYETSKYVIKELGEEYLDNSIPANGKKSFSFIHSTISSEYVDLIVTYNVKFRVPFINLPEIPIVQRCRIHAWSGKTEKNDIETAEDDIVYVARNGTVYHRSLNCTYLRFDIEKIVYSDVVNRRNFNGGKYYACERCIKDSAAKDSVYITKTGTRYHNSIACSELKRTIDEIRLSQAKSKYRPCNRCGSAAY